MPKILKFLIGLGVVVVICLVTAWLFGVQWFAKWMVGKTASKNPLVRVVPKPLADTSINNAPGTDESYRNYSFEVPWKDTPKVSNYGAGGSVYSFGPHTVTLYSLRPNGMIESLKKNPQNQQNIDTLFEGDPPKTDYDFMRRILAITPDTFTWSMNKTEAVRDGTLLFVKTKNVPVEAASGIFYVTTPEFHGFQYGVPESKETGVEVDLYSDRVLLKFTFRERGGAPALIPQPDINRVVQSVRRGSNLGAYDLGESGPTGKN
jgi:hypothetical protein